MLVRTVVRLYRWDDRDQIKDRMITLGLAQSVSIPQQGITGNWTECEPASYLINAKALSMCFMRDTRDGEEPIIVTVEVQ